LREGCGEVYLRGNVLHQNSMQRCRRPYTWIQEDTGQEYNEDTVQGTGVLKTQEDTVDRIQCRRWCTTLPRT
jgi:hypothetical protein